MIIDNLIPKDYYNINLLPTLPVDLVCSLNQRVLQTKAFYLFKHESLDSYIFVRVAFHCLQVCDFESLDDLIDYLKSITEDAII